MIYAVVNETQDNIEHQSCYMSRKRTPWCSAFPNVSRGRSAQLQDNIHIPEVCAGIKHAPKKKHALIITNKHRELHAVASCHVKETYMEPPPFSSSFFFYLLGGERLRPVVQNEPVFIEGFELCRRFLALLPVCDFTVFIHG